MARYSEQFKRAVVREYLSEGSDGYRATAKRHAVKSHTVVERWVAAFQRHGDAGLGKKSSKYSAEYKLLVLRHMWENQISINQSAAKFDIRMAGRG